MTSSAQAGPLAREREISPLLVEQSGALRWIRLNRPDSRNALNPALVTALDAAVADAMADEQTRVVVLGGTGPSFCSGADLRYLLGLARAGLDPVEFLAATSACFSRIERAEKPVLAAVHGHVVAGGLELALACDAVVARTGTLIGDGHVRNGLLPGAGASLRLPRKVGEPLARWLMLSGELVPAERFLASGFVHAVEPPETFEPTVSALATGLATVGKDCHGRVKELLGGWDEANSADALNRELRIFAAHWRERDVESRLKKFVHREKE